MIRESNGLDGTEWQVVPIDANFDKFELGSGLAVRERLKWLKEYEGLGKFYFDSMFDQVYFERDEDREMFILRWM